MVRFPAWVIVAALLLLVPQASAVLVSVEASADIENTLVDAEGAQWLGCRGGNGCSPPPSGACTEEEVDGPGNRILFSEGATTTACADLLLTWPWPSGAKAASIGFMADRGVEFGNASGLGPGPDPASQSPLPGVNAVQAIRIYDSPQAFREVLYFQPGRGNVTEPMPIGPFPISRGEQPVVMLSYFFEEDSGLFQQTVPNVGQGYSFRAGIYDVSLVFSAISRAAELIEVQVLVDEADRRVTEYDVLVNLTGRSKAVDVNIQAARRDNTTDRQLTFVSAETDLGAIPHDAVSITDTAGNHSLRAVVAAGNHSWIRFTVQEEELFFVAPPVPPAPPTVARWIPILLAILPVPAAILATRAVYTFNGEAKGHYRSTARALIGADIALAAFYVAALATLALIGLRRAGIIPPETVVIILYVWLILALAGFTTLWIMSATSLTRTMRRDLAERATQAEELRRSNLELEQFAYVASHDLQEPLRKIAASTALVKKRYGKDLPEDAHKWMGYAVDGAARMQALIRSLLEYSRAGRSELRIDDVPLEGVLRRVVDDLEEAVKDRDADVDIGPLPVVSGDRARLQQLMQNLVSNALKYHDGSRKPRVSVGAEPVKDGVEIWVQDNGIGIAPQHREQIFGVFTRLHNKETYPGTGIGLALCHRIVERHGGDIWVADRDGPGTEFRVFLPGPATWPPA